MITGFLEPVIKPPDNLPTVLHGSQRGNMDFHGFGNWYVARWGSVVVGTGLLAIFTILWIRQTEKTWQSFPHSMEQF